MNTYIFDLDGTLLDSMDVWYRIDVEFLERRGIVLPPDYAASISGMSFTETAAYTIARFGLPDTVESLKAEWNSMAAYAYGNTVKLKPYAKAYLETLRGRGAKLAVATSLSRELYEPALKSNGVFEMFHALSGSDEAGQGKSRPDVFLLAAKKTGAAPEDCVVFEDILEAVKTAKGAGMKVCGVYDEASKSDWEEIKQSADYAILDWRDAPL